MWKHLVTRELRRDRNTRSPACRLTVEELEGRLLLSGDMVLQWNSVLQQAARNAPASQVPLFRNLALVHVAIYEAVNAIDHTHTPYLVDLPAPSGASADAAAAKAAHDTLVALYPAQQALFDAKLEESLATVGDGDAKSAGIQVGQAAAQNILAARHRPGSVAADSAHLCARHASPYPAHNPFRHHQQRAVPPGTSAGHDECRVRGRIQRSESARLGEQYRPYPRANRGGPVMGTAHQQPHELGTGRPAGGSGPGYFPD
jgi:hypothetical protein